jgi:hypothetical protein
MSITESDRQVADQARDDFSAVGEFRWDLVIDSWWWSDALYRLYGCEPSTVVPTMERSYDTRIPTTAGASTRCSVGAGRKAGRSAATTTSSTPTAGRRRSWRLVTANEAAQIQRSYRCADF